MPSESTDGLCPRSVRLKGSKSEYHNVPVAGIRRMERTDDVTQTLWDWRRGRESNPRIKVLQPLERPSKAVCLQLAATK